MAHGVVRTDNMYGTDVRSGLVCLAAEAEMDNGCVVVVGNHTARDYYVANTPTAAAKAGTIALIATPEGDYQLDKFTNPAGSLMRGYILHDGDTFGVTLDALTGKAQPAVDDIVEMKAGTKMNVVAAATGKTSGSTAVGKIIAIEKDGLHTYYVIRVNFA